MPNRVPISLGPSLALAAVLVLHPPAVAQIIQIEGGGSTLFDAQGGAVTIQNENSRMVIGAGLVGGQFGYGVSASFRRGDYTFLVGDNPIPVNLPTDVFDNVHYFMARGAGVSTTKMGWHMLAFAGATAEGLSTPFFPASKTDAGAGVIYLDRSLTEKLHFYSVNIVSQKQTSIQGVDWKLRDWMTLAAAAGVGSNQPYAGTSLTIQKDRLWVRLGYVYEGDRFRRVTVQSPINSEVDRGNVLVVANPFRKLSVIAGHQQLLQPQQNPNLPFLRATVNQLQVSGEVAGFQVGTGLFQSQQKQGSNLGQVAWASRKVSSWLETGAQYYRNESSHNSTSSTITGSFREILSPRLSILELVNHSRQTTVGFGGSFQSNLISIDVDYSTVYVPFGNAQFKQALGFTVRFHPFGNVTLNAQSYLTSDGQTKYSVSGSTYIYRGLPFMSNPDPGRGHLDKYIVRGRVVDAEGNPVEGAAVKIDKNVLLTNSSGEFFLRTKRAGSYRLEVALEEFANAAPFELVSAPAEVHSAREENASTVSVVLKLKGTASHPAGMSNLGERQMRPDPPKPNPALRTADGEP